MYYIFWLVADLLSVVVNIISDISMLFNLTVNIASDIRIVLLFLPFCVCSLFAWGREVADKLLLIQLCLCLYIFMCSRCSGDKNHGIRSIALQNAVMQQFNQLAWQMICNLTLLFGISPYYQLLLLFMFSFS
jgi:hypothetical protein